VSKLHEQGIFGEGVRIGVVDTGIYYLHDAVSFSKSPCAMYVLDKGYGLTGVGSLVEVWVLASKLLEDMTLSVMGVIHLKNTFPTTSLD
jgi:hypothetical protein